MGSDPYLLQRIRRDWATNTHTHTHTRTQERPQVRKELPKENGACQPLNSLMPIKTLGYLLLSIKNTSVLCITRFPIFGFNQLWFKIFGKKNSGSFKTQNLNFLCTSKYLHSIYISSGIISNIDLGQNAVTEWDFGSFLSCVEWMNAFCGYEHFLYWMHG